ncbi:MAG: platelet-activating factor acetylhydrolase IB subunit [Planctomycetota bacterium]|nr:platelet-activating factor acetylhydrolase IB subunit [Planctomycetota bacterium]
MKKILVFLLLIGIEISATGQDQQPKDEILAVKAEIQTAKWAEKWWMPRHKQKLADLKKQKKVDLLFIGDSITHGFEGSGKETWEKYYAPRNAFNIGYSGDRTEHVIWRLQNGEVEGISPKLTVVMIGTNNTGHRKEKPEHTAAGIKKIIQELQTRLKKTKILLLAIFPRDAKPDGQYRVINDGVNEIIKGFANDQEGVYFLDISDQFLAEDGSLPKSIMPDLLHPNKKGYAIWADAIEPTVKKLMEK